MSSESVLGRCLWGMPLGMSLQLGDIFEDDSGNVGLGKSLRFFRGCLSIVVFSSVGDVFGDFC